MSDHRIVSMPTRATKPKASMSLMNSEAAESADVDSYFPTVTKRAIKSDKKKRDGKENERNPPSPKNKEPEKIKKSRGWDEWGASLPRDFNDDIPILHKQRLGRPTDEELQAIEAAGVKIKWGRFSVAESALVRSNYEAYIKEFGGDYVQLFGFGQGASGNRERRALRLRTGFFARLAHGLPDRHIWSVYLHARRLLHPSRATSKKRFTEKETKKLLQFRQLHGDDYITMAEAFDVTPQSLRDRVRWVEEQPTSGSFTATELLALIMCVCEVHHLKDFNRARYLKLNQIKWSKVRKLMGTRTYQSCKDGWLHVMLPDCVSPNKAQLYFLCSLIRAYAKDGWNDYLWDQLAHDVGIADGEIARRFFYLRKHTSLGHNNPEKELASLSLRKSAKLLMRNLQTWYRIKTFTRFEFHGGEARLHDIPLPSSRHNISWEYDGIDV